MLGLSLLAHMSEPSDATWRGHTHTHPHTHIHTHTLDRCALTNKRSCLFVLLCVCVCVRMKQLQLASCARRETSCCLVANHSRSSEISANQLLAGSGPGCLRNTMRKQVHPRIRQGAELRRRLAAPTSPLLPPRLYLAAPTTPLLPRRLPLQPLLLLSIFPLRQGSVTQKNSGGFAVVAAGCGNWGSLNTWHAAAMFFSMKRHRQLSARHCIRSASVFAPPLMKTQEKESEIGAAFLYFFPLSSTPSLHFPFHRSEKLSDTEAPA